MKDVKNELELTTPRIPSHAKTIRQYQNRKLYDPELSRYVTLDEIADMIRGGTQISVRKSDNQKDITAETLTKIVLDRQKSRRRPLSVRLLHSIIRQGDESSSAFLENGPLFDLLKVVSELDARVRHLNSLLAQDKTGT